MPKYKISVTPDGGKETEREFELKDDDEARSEAKKMLDELCAKPDIHPERITTSSPCDFSIKVKKEGGWTEIIP